MELEEIKKLTAQGEREYFEETLESSMIKRIETKLRNLDWQKNEIKEGLEIIRKRVLVDDS